MSKSKQPKSSKPETKPEGSKQPSPEKSGAKPAKPVSPPASKASPASSESPPASAPSASAKKPTKPKSPSPSSPSSTPPTPQAAPSKKGTSSTSEKAKSTSEPAQPQVSPKTANDKVAEKLKPKGRGATVEVKERQVVNPEVVLLKRVKSETHKPITVAWARKALGYIEEMENVPIKDPHGKDINGKKFFCTNNISNRPIDWGKVVGLMQEILRRRWRLNGEPIIIGRTGLILNGQKQLLALIMAAIEWHKHPGHWKDYWQEEPYIDKLVVAGIEEDDNVVNTLDTAQPRTLADVVARSHYFADLKLKQRKELASVTDYAIRMLWQRTGAFLDPQTAVMAKGKGLKRTHAESLSTLDRHPRLLECIKHIVEEDGGKERRIFRYITLGAAAGLMYLMGASATERENDTQTGYLQVPQPSEAQIDWSLWDKAQEFWVKLAAGDKSFAQLVEQMLELRQRAGGGRNERIALLVQAWNLYADGKKFTPASLELQFTQDDRTGLQVLEGCPAMGGIDLGNPQVEAAG